MVAVLSIGSSGQGIAALACALLGLAYSAALYLESREKLRLPRIRGQPRSRIHQQIFAGWVAFVSICVFVIGIGMLT